MKISTWMGTKEMPETSKKLNKRNVNDGENSDDPEFFGLGNVPACMASCRNRFTKELGINPSGDTESDLKLLCHKLIDGYLSPRLGELYCCDAQYCGLGIIGHGSDPNVDKIIGQCSNIGVNGIIDPGPPEPSHCSRGKDNSDGSGTDGFTMDTANSMQTSSPFGTGSTRLTTTSTGLSLTASSTTKVTMDSHSGDASNSSSNDLNNAGKIAVGICSTIAAMAVIFVIWCLRRRKRSAKGYMQTPPPMTRAFKAHYQEPSDSHASLITTTTTPPPLPPPPPPPPVATASGTKSPQPLTPPMRLSDRRFLPSVSSPASIRSSSAPPYSSQPDLVIPEHPAFPPSTHRNSPPYCHHETTSSMEEKSTQIYNSHNIEIPRSSLSSGGAASTTGSETTLTSPSSPSRPRRPHETPLLVPGLITPAGPPPERALPTTPLLPQQQQQQLVLASSPLLKSSSRSLASSSPVAPVSPLSPTSPSMQTTTLARSVSPVPSPGEIGLAIGTAQDDGVSAPSQVHHARGRGNRGTQDSGWGIWMGSSGNKDNKDGDATMQRQQEQAGSTEHSLRLTDRKNDQIGVDIVLRELEMAKLSGSC